MDIFAPIYYKDFKCIADKCKHNCCIGWEIDVDEDSLSFYSKHSDIMSKIDTDGIPHFVLEENERCPFLNSNNLCNLIINYGEEALCQICRDHPRFRNYFDTRTEIGLGLTCEAAARLILDNDFSLVKIGEDIESAFKSQEEADFFNYRDKLFSKDVTDFKYLLPNKSVEELSNEFRKLERLDNAWDNILETLKGRKEKISNINIKDRAKANRLFNYFLFRNLYDYGLSFCVLCTYFILSIDYCLYETARMFSSEIEYSDENTEKILEMINEQKNEQFS